MALHYGNRGPGHLSRLFGAYTPITITPPSPTIGQPMGLLLLLTKAS